MISGQINGVYNVEYFDAANNEYGKTDSQMWWSSVNRYASEASEYIEVDLEKKRTINYLSLDVMRKPIDITIEYDAIDLDDIDQYSDIALSRWVSVVPMDQELFDSSVTYEASTTNPWKHCQFYFTDQFGDTLTARRIRITFTRRDEGWPTADYPAFQWSVDARALRIGRYINKADHTRGVLIETPSLSSTKTFTEYPELRQRFFVPESAQISSSATTDLSNIDSFTPTDISPRLMGFEMLVQPDDFNKDIALSWELYDVTFLSTLVDKGEIRKRTRDTTDYHSEISTRTIPPEWVRVLFDASVPTVAGNKYEMRIRNINGGELNSFYISDSAFLKSESTNSTIDSDLYYTDNAGITNRLQSQSLVYRIFADVGMFGKDLLGNEYREGVRYNSAANAVDNKLYTNWTCFPNPSSEGVESLYFDVRKISNGKASASVVDAIEVNTLTPGVRMNVYFSNQIMSSAPNSIDDWENVMWTPLRDSFKLNQKQTIDLPYPIVANWICLEFYNLQPIPMSIPNYPILPEVEFKEFPDWVYTHNPLPKSTSDEPYLEREKFVGFTIPEIMAGQVENDKGLRIRADVPQTLEESYKLNGFGTADPSLLGKVSFSKNPYSSPSVTRVDGDSLLGQHVYDDYISDYSQTYIAEAQQFPRIVGRRSVSNTNDRMTATRDDERSLMFNRVCAHQYAVRKARYNKKAYSVSISEVNFLKKDYTVQVDDSVVHDLLVISDSQQSDLIEHSTWEPEQAISMPVGNPIFVTYTVDNVTYTDETVYFEESGSSSPSFSPVDLNGSGKIATNVIARSGANKKGDTYYRDQDFVIVYDPSSKKNRIQRNNIPARLVVGFVTHSLDKYTIQGRGGAATAASESVIALAELPAVTLSAGTTNVALTFEEHPESATATSGLFGVVQSGSNLIPISCSISSEASIYATLEIDD